MMLRCRVLVALVLETLSEMIGHDNAKSDNLLVARTVVVTDSIHLNISQS